jgi:large subunit ribosomal protein L24
MKRKFSTAWKASSQPRKQRKYAANAPLHLKRKLLSVNLAKDLRKKHGMKNIVLRKGDTVKVMRGKFKGKKGKVNEVKIKLAKIYVEGIQTKKRDGSTVNVPSRASNLQIVELNIEDRKRFGKAEEGKKDSADKVAKTSTKGKEATQKDSKTNEGAKK